jgi:hypothetical protein
LIAGILLAPAYIDQQALELTALVAPVPVQQQQQQKQEAKPEKQELAKNVDVRQQAIADVSRADWCRRKSQPRPAISRRCDRMCRP